MKYILFYSIIKIVLSLKILPHFIFDGIESFHKCQKEQEEIFFTIYGSLLGNYDKMNIIIENYTLEKIGFFRCSFSENKIIINRKRRHKIICSINGIFERFGYILEEPKVHGFDFMTEEGKSSWPEKPEKRMILIGECGNKVELKEEILPKDSLINYSNSINSNKKYIIDNALSNLPKREDINESKMLIEMKNLKEKYILTDAECAYLVFKWITENIENNCYNLFYNINGDVKDEINTYNKGIGGSYGKSLLFKKMSQALGLESDIIIGFSKISTFNGSPKISKTDHFWNYVKIGNLYYLIDATNGAGYCDGDIFMKYLSDFYFCPKPEFFIHLFYPVISKWQLLPNIISFEQFVSKSLILDTFYEFGFNNIYPDSSIIKVDEGKLFLSLNYDNMNINKNMVIFCNIFYLNNNIPVQVHNSCLIIKEKGKAIVNIVLNDIREYILIILAGPNYSQVYTEFEEILAMKINSTNKTEKILSFPGITPSYLFSDIELIEPLYDLLIKGSFIDFKIKADCFNNLYLLVDDNIIREFDRKYDGTFFAESVYIFGEKIKILSKNLNSDKDIVEYNTINGENIEEELTFPKVYSNAFKAILYSPLNYSLKKGMHYNFKIKSEISKEIIVSDGINTYKLINKKGIFSGNIKISENSNEVVISEYLFNNEYSRFYKYEVL